MTTSERLLRRWRKEALKEAEDIRAGLQSVNTLEPRSELLRKILAMTSELLDQHLLKK